jgi:hypothetical protein
MGTCTAPGPCLIHSGVAVADGNGLGVMVGVCVGSLVKVGGIGLGVADGVAAARAMPLHPASNSAVMSRIDR